MGQGTITPSLSVTYLQLAQFLAERHIIV